MDRISNQKARVFLSALPPKPPRAFESKFPNADLGALDLLRRLLSFDPVDRPTAVEALAHPYFSGLPNATQQVRRCAVRACLPRPPRRPVRAPRACTPGGTPGGRVLNTTTNQPTGCHACDPRSLCQIYATFILRGARPAAITFLSQAHCTPPPSQEIDPIAGHHFDFELQKLTDADVRQLIYAEVGSP